MIISSILIKYAKFQEVIACFSSFDCKNAFSILTFYDQTPHKNRV
ncbi:hypothetical protein HMPREF1396_00675 [Helicobacter pylori GAM114Ai]|nr:hypothetical protein HMPREF1396_00675 [Helicobacter pylori GAM114Ai]EMH32858.1 hypothetical protein HMPREF1426_01666 [Helicobacter pylori GAM80Ai]